MSLLVVVVVVVVTVPLPVGGEQTLSFDSK